MQRCVGVRSKCGGGFVEKKANDSAESANTTPRDFALGVTPRDWDVLRQEVDDKVARFGRKIAFLEELCKDRVELVTVNFEPGDMGFSIDYETGLVTEVAAGSQAQAGGINTGMFFDRCGGYEWVSPENVKRYANGSEPFQVAFKKASEAKTDLRAAASERAQLQWQALTEKRFNDVQMQLQTISARQLTVQDIMDIPIEITNSANSHDGAIPVEVAKEIDQHRTRSRPSPAMIFPFQAAASTTGDVMDETSQYHKDLSHLASTQPHPADDYLGQPVLAEPRDSNLSSSALLVQNLGEPALIAGHHAPVVTDADALTKLEDLVLSLQQEVGQLSLRLQEDSASRNLVAARSSAESTKAVHEIDVQDIDKESDGDIEEVDSEWHRRMSSEDRDKEEQYKDMKTHQRQDKLFENMTTIQLCSKRFAEIHEVTERYQVTESVWDLAIFIGCTEVGFCGSIFGVVLLGMTIFMQFAFCAIINDSFTMETVDAHLVGELQRWRTFSAHDLKWIDPISHQSLARRVCELDGSLPMSSSVIEVLQTIRTYLPSSEDRQHQISIGNAPFIGFLLPEFEMIGQSLCLLALSVWYLTLSKDLSEVKNLFMALKVMPTESRTRIELKRDHVTRLASMTPTRKVLVAALLISRLVALCFMCFCGTLFLAYTISMTEIILNAVALDIVFSLDELIFQALAPSQVRALMKSLAPLPTRAQALNFRGLNSKPVVFLGLMLGLCLTTYLAFLQPQVDLLREAREAICGGNVGFVATVNNYGAVVAAPDAGIDRPSVEYSTTYVYKAFKELINNPDALSLDIGVGSLSHISVGLSGAAFSLEGNEVMSVEEVTSYWNYACKDYAGNGHQMYYQEILADAIASNAQRVTCNDIRSFCNHDSPAGVRSRQICPETCGCKDPTSALIMNLPSQGCSKRCIQEEIFSASLATLPCTDMNQTSENFTHYMTGLAELRSSYPPQWKGLVTGIMTKLTNQGCAALVPGGFQPWDAVLQRNGSWWVDLCDVKNTYNIKPLRHVCPQTCKCKTAADPFLCPSSCQR